LVDDFSKDTKAHPEVEGELRKNMAPFKNVQIVKKSSLEAANMFKVKSIDMVFIDGAHDRKSVYDDIEAWSPKCKVLLCGHDFNQESVQLGILDTDYPSRVETGSIWSIDKTKLKYDGR